MAQCTSRPIRRAEIMKKLSLLLMVLLFVSTTAAYNFGTFTYQDSKQAETRNVSFQIGMINPENSSLDIGISSEGLQNGRIVFPQNDFSLEPSEVTDTPQGDGWLAVNSGRYAKVEKVQFWVVMDQKINEDFQVNVQAQKSSTDNAAIKPRTVQVRSYSYEIKYPEEQTNKASRGYERGQESDEELDFVKPSEDEAEQEKNNKSVQGSVKELNQSLNASESSKTNQAATSKQEGLDGTTAMLAVGALGSLLYLWKVI